MVLQDRPIVVRSLFCAQRYSFLEYDVYALALVWLQCVKFTCVSLHGERMCSDLNDVFENNKTAHHA